MNKGITSTYQMRIVDGAISYEPPDECPFCGRRAEHHRDWIVVAAKPGKVRRLRLPLKLCEQHRQYGGHTVLARRSFVTVLIAILLFASLWALMMLPFALYMITQVKTPADVEMSRTMLAVCLGLSVLGVVVYFVARRPISGENKGPRFWGTLLDNPDEVSVKVKGAKNPLAKALEAAALSVTHVSDAESRTEKQKARPFWTAYVAVLFGIILPLVFGIQSLPAIVRVITIVAFSAVMSLISKAVPEHLRWRVGLILIMVLALANVAFFESEAAGWVDAGRRVPEVFKANGASVRLVAWGINVIAFFAAALALPKELRRTPPAAKE